MTTPSDQEMRAKFEEWAKTQPHLSVYLEYGDYAYSEYIGSEYIAFQKGFQAAYKPRIEVDNLGDVESAYKEGFCDGIRNADSGYAKDFWPKSKAYEALQPLTPKAE